MDGSHAAAGPESTRAEIPELLRGSQDCFDRAELVAAGF
jgi:hypothetical protein